MLSLCTSVEVNVLTYGVATRQRMNRRFTGSLTGSRVAGSLGKLVVLDTCRKCVLQGRLRPAILGTEQLGLATWVDNIYSFGLTPTQAAQH